MSQEKVRAEDWQSPPGDVQVTYDVKITPRLVMAIVGPYVAEKFMEQVKALAPVSLFLFAFQILVLRSGIRSPFVERCVHAASGHHPSAAPTMAATTAVVTVSSGMMCSVAARRIDSVRRG